jgi:hypothetical protein
MAILAHPTGKALAPPRGLASLGRILSGRLFWRSVVLAVILATGGVFVQHARASADFRAFDPQQMGRLEAGMWRSYYEGRWIRLGRQTMQVSCGQYGFSWWDGFHLARHAATAAKHFRKDQNDPRCQRQLEAYYRIVQRRAAPSIDTAELARLELRWWTERRLNAAPHDYAQTISRLTGALYGITPEAAFPAAKLRTAAMAYRDARRNGKMTEADWLEVRGQLTAAYTALKNEVGDPRP